MNALAASITAIVIVLLFPRRNSLLAYISVSLPSARYPTQEPSKQSRPVTGQHSLHPSPQAPASTGHREAEQGQLQLPCFGSMLTQ
jgi:hypothetical protein